MADKATIEYQVVCGGEQLLYDETIEGKVTVTEYGPANDLIEIEGDAKTVYVHRAHLVSVIIHKASDTEVERIVD